MSMDLLRMPTVVAGMAAFVLACTSQVEGGGARPQDPRGGSFVSVAAERDGEPLALVDGSRIALRLEDARIAWDAGCNTTSGEVDIDANRLDVRDRTLSSTLRGCPELLAQDQWVSAFFQADPTWELDGAKLTLTAEQTRVVFEAE